ncbi:hypothetical protein FISHEDRAFT_19172, partial [Fistulina hepatica ATCC 64428]
SVVVLDELDHIASEPSALRSIFTLAVEHASVLRIIGVANTHTLTSDHSLVANASVQTLHFPPYTSSQLREILRTRLSSIDDEQMMTCISPPALALLTKKVATMTGDVRSLFEVLRSALEMAAALDIAVAPLHINAALKTFAPSMGTSTDGRKVDEIVIKIRALCIQARIVLLAMLLALRRLDSGLGLGKLSTAPT